MPTAGSASTRLIIIRGNSASGKTSAAWAIRQRYGPGLAIVSQDVIRRDILRVQDDSGNSAIGLIDHTARYALNHGYHVVVEGIMHRTIYGEMLTQLVRDHAGVSGCFYYGLDFDETVRRHSSKAQAAEYGADEMRDWYRKWDVISALNETDFSVAFELDDVVSRISQTVHLPDNRT